MKLTRIFIYSSIFLLTVIFFGCSNQPSGSGTVSENPQTHQEPVQSVQPEQTAPVPQQSQKVESQITPPPSQSKEPPKLPPASVSFPSPNNPNQTIHIERKPATTVNQPPRFNEQGVPIGNEVGNDLGDFVNYNPDSVLMRLSDLRGKVVMVMLWNSLCHHCIVDNEKYREIYNKYHNKKFIHGDGFDIYAIGLDKERETWLKALRERQYPWKNNVYVIDSWKDRDVRFFGVKNLPGTFLIDRNGIVLNKLFTPEQLDTILQGYLVK